MELAHPTSPYPCDFPWEGLSGLRRAPFPLLDGLQGPLPRKYEILGALGRGAFGTVLLARDRFLDRPVALKILHSDCAADLSRFRREARLMARLEHAAVVRILEMDESEGRTYVAMEYLDGGHLGRVRLQPRELVRALRPVVDALAHAHAVGIVHRDIKPENILLDHARRAFLTDFGLARDARDAEVTNEGILGTPRTMSPEQARGEAGRVDARSDVFSLGVTLHHALTGAWPFRGDDLESVLTSIRHDEPVSPRSFVPDLPAALNSIVLRCLEKDPARRFQSMEGLGRALDRFLTQESCGWRGFVRRIISL